MPISYVPESIDQACKCGRLNNKIHCPACGYYTVEGRAGSTKRLMPNGQTQEFAIFKCRRCNLRFDDYQWRVECEAPKFETKSMRDKRLQRAGRESWDNLMASKGGNRKEALKELFKNFKPPHPMPSSTEE